MRRAAWAIVVTCGGALGMLMTVFINVGALPMWLAVFTVGGIPLLALGAAFIGLGYAHAVLGWAVVSVTAIVAPILDVTIHSLEAGNFDDARGYGFGTGIALVLAGALGVWRSTNARQRSSSGS